MHEICVVPMKDRPAAWQHHKQVHSDSATPCRLSWRLPDQAGRWAVQCQAAASALPLPPGARRLPLSLPPAPQRTLAQSRPPPPMPHSCPTLSTTHALQQLAMTHKCSHIHHIENGTVVQNAHEMLRMAVASTRSSDACRQGTRQSTSDHRSS